MMVESIFLISNFIFVFSIWHTQFGILNLAYSIWHTQFGILKLVFYYWKLTIPPGSSTLFNVLKFSNRYLLYYIIYIHKVQYTSAVMWIVYVSTLFNVLKFSSRYLLYYIYSHNVQYTSAVMWLVHVSTG